MRFSHSKKCSLFVIIVKSLKFSKIRRMNAPFFRSVDGRKWWRHSCERAPQLKGTIQLICDNITSDNIAKTEMLLLNDNVLHSIDGISRFSVSPLEILNLSNNSLEGCMRSFINTVYNHHHLVVIKVLSVFVALLSDKEIVLPKENAEEIIIAIVGGSACVFPSVRCCCTRTPPFATR